MRSTQFVLFPLESGWRVAIVGDEVVFEMADTPAAVGAILNAYGDRMRAWIALPSVDCLCTTLSTRISGDSLKYQLEEILPWSAEDFVTATARGRARATDDEIFVVAIKQQPYQQMLRSLKSANIDVAGVSPAALLAASGLSDNSRGDLSGEKDEILLLEDETPHWKNLIRLRGRTPVVWNFIHDEQLPARLAADDFKGDTPPQRPEHVMHRPMAEIAAIEAASVLERRSQPLINFSEKRSAGSFGFMSAVACAAVLLGVCCGLAWRTADYNDSASRSDAATREIFTRVFPNSPIPAGVVSRLVGEARAVRAASGVVGDLPEQSKSLAPALGRLLQSLGSLPPTVRFTVDDLTVDSRHWTIAGQAASIGDVQRVADALHTLNGWAIDPPRTVQQLTAVNFTIQATSESTTPQSVAAGGMP